MPRFLIPILCLFSFSVVAQPELELSLYVDGLQQPADITNAGDERLFIVERPGRIRIVDGDDNLLSTPYLDIDGRVSPATGERGLLGLAFHPDYAENGYFYVNYTRNSGATRISRFSVSENDPNVADPNSELVLLDISQPYSNHNAGDLAFGPDGYLYIPMGDGGSGGDPQDFSQNRQSLLGKMIRIDVDNGSPYSIPADNPFINDDNILDEIWAIGLRNPWRFSFDRLTGDLWIGDVGQNAWEEINYVPAGTGNGANFGWRCYEGLVPYNLSGCEDAENYTFPIHTYGTGSSDGCSVTGGFVYRGVDQPGLYGKYVYADFCSNKFWILEPTSSDGWRNTQVLNSSGGIATFGQDSNGELYVGALSAGRVYRLTTNCETPAMPAIEGDTVFCAGDNGAMLSAEEAPEGYTYAWYLDGKFLALTDSPSYEATIEGSYQLRWRANELGRCDSPFSNEWNVNEATPPDPLITLDGDALQATDGMQSYQWYLDGAAIPGATMATYLPETSGGYSVEVVDANGCTWQSVELVIVENLDRLGLEDVSVTPNPFAAELMLSLRASTPQLYQLSLLNLNGQQLWSIELQQVTQWSKRIDTTDWPAGVYILVVRQGEQVLTRKIVK
jgi:glucose/arabinose dehydrogenase